jgi:hypothetical protein
LTRDAAQRIAGLEAARGGEAAAARSNESGGRLLSEAFLIYWRFGSLAGSSGTRSGIPGKKTGSRARHLNLSHPLSS